jgi:nucleotide-binding universal stress UspA family protein
MIYFCIRLWIYDTPAFNCHLKYSRSIYSRRHNLNVRITRNSTRLSNYMVTTLSRTIYTIYTKVRFIIVTKVNNDIENKLKNIKKIILPIDGSATSMKAARIGISLSKKFRSDLIGLTVIDLMSLPYGYFLTPPGTRSHDNILEEKRSEAKKWLDEVEKSMLEALGEPQSVEIKFRSEIIEDPFSRVESAIINYAESEGVDLIVMGTRGRSGFKRILLGSVASGVLSYAHCLVMTVR